MDWSSFSETIEALEYRENVSVQEIRAEAVAQQPIEPNLFEEIAVVFRQCREAGEKFLGSWADWTPYLFPAAECSLGDKVEREIELTDVVESSIEQTDAVEDESNRSKAGHKSRSGGVVDRPENCNGEGSRSEAICGS